MCVLKDDGGNAMSCINDDSSARIVCLLVYSLATGLNVEAESTSHGPSLKVLNRRYWSQACN